MHGPHDVGGEVLGDRSVDQHVAAVGHRRQDAGQGDGGLQGAPQAAAAVQVIGPGRQVAGYAEIGQPEVGHLDVAEVLLQALADLPAPGHGHHGEGGVAERAGVHEGLADAPVEFLVAPAHGHARGDDRAHRCAADQVDGDVARMQGADHANVGVGAGAAAGQHQPQ